MPSDQDAPGFGRRILARVTQSLSCGVGGGRRKSWQPPAATPDSPATATRAQRASAHSPSNRSPVELNYGNQTGSYHAFFTHVCPAAATPSDGLADLGYEVLQERRDFPAAEHSRIGLAVRTDANRHHFSHRRLALIKLRSVTRDRDPVAWKEAAILQAIDHANIVSLIGLFCTGSESEPRSIRQQVWLLLRFESGGNLEELISRSGFLTERLARSLASNVAAGAQHLHAKRVIHGKICPAHVLIREYPADGKVAGVLCGFGSAVILTPEERILSNVRPDVLGIVNLVGSMLQRSSSRISTLAADVVDRLPRDPPTSIHALTMHPWFQQTEVRRTRREEEERPASPIQAIQQTRERLHALYSGIRRGNERYGVLPGLRDRLPAIGNMVMHRLRRGAYELQDSGPPVRPEQSGGRRSPQTVNVQPKSYRRVQNSPPPPSPPPLERKEPRAQAETPGDPASESSEGEMTRL